MKSDPQVQQDVIAELKWEPSIEAAQIGVEVRDGIVTLTGHVNSFAEKWDAERAVQRVSGVKALAIEIDVKLVGSSKRLAADIARSAENILEWTSCLPKDAVKVMVEGSWITLSGEVDWEYQRQAAGDAVRYLMGVTGMSNEIGIKRGVSSSTIQSGVEAALERSSRPNHQNVSVAVRDGEVTLTGDVHSLSERELAGHSAWNAPGVRNVVNKINLAY